MASAESAILTPGYPNKTQVIEYVKEAFLEANSSCSVPWVLDFADPISTSTSLTFHNVITIVSGGCCVLSTLIAVYLLVSHFRHFTNPSEQKQYARIILFVPAFALCAVFSIWFYHADGYIAPFGQWYEAFAICALYLLYLQIVTDGNDLHGSGQASQSPHSLEKGPDTGGRAVWDKRTAMMVFQIMLTRPITVIASEALYGTTCPLASERRKGAMTLSFVQMASTFIAVIGCFRTERRFKNDNDMRRQKALLKLVAFKIVVLLEAIQVTVFSTLADKEIFIPMPPYLLSWNDFAKGLPQLMLSVEIVFVAILFFWAYGSKPYRTSEAGTGAGKALLQTLDISDVLRATIAAFTGGNGAAMEERHGLMDYSLPTGEQHANMDATPYARTGEYNA